MYAANPMRTRRETGETRKEKSAPKELDNCGHIEGLNGTRKNNRFEMLNLRRENSVSRWINKEVSEKELAEG
jgi:hypothetical protein